MELEVLEKILMGVMNNYFIDFYKYRKLYREC